MKMRKKKLVVNYRTMRRNYQYWDTGDSLYNKLAGTEHEYVWKDTGKNSGLYDTQLWVATQIAKVNTIRTPSRLSGITTRG